MSMLSAAPFRAVHRLISLSRIQGRTRSWRPGRVTPRNRGLRAFASTQAQPIQLRLVMPDDSEFTTTAYCGETLLQALERADISDVWEGGACGGACSCSTCKVIMEPSVMETLEGMEEEELDMLESAAEQEEDSDASELFLKNARLSCQVEVSTILDGCAITIPEDTRNMLEVPLWMRSR